MMRERGEIIHESEGLVCFVLMHGACLFNYVRFQQSYFFLLCSCFVIFLYSAVLCTTLVSGVVLRCVLRTRYADVTSSLLPSVSQSCDHIIFTRYLLDYYE